MMTGHMCHLKIIARHTIIETKTQNKKSLKKI